jgi:hypothetical protein
MEGYMSVWPTPASHPYCLSGAEGELVSVCISTDPRLLEELLDCLAELSFPINPQIRHGRPTSVEFPAYAGRLIEVRNCLHKHSLDRVTIQVSNMLDTISA